MKILKFLSVLGLLLATNTYAQDNKISFAGDSIAYGLGMTGPYSNGGIVGAGVAVGNPVRNEAHWLQYTKSTQLTIVEIGTNDFWYKGNEDHYQSLLSTYILPLNKNICLVEAPLSERSDIRQGVLRIKPFIQNWANQNNIKMVSFPTYTLSDRTPDGIHFTLNAYKRLAKEIVEKCL